MRPGREMRVIASQLTVAFSRAIIQAGHLFFAALFEKGVII
jgi:hypothetical protein